MMLDHKSSGEAFSTKGVVYRARAPKDTPFKSFLDTQSSLSWQTIVKRVETLAEQSGVVVVDIASSSLMRNDLYRSGLAKVRAATQKRGIPLVLAGMDERSASRLEENASFNSETNLQDRRRLDVARVW